MRSTPQTVARPAFRSARRRHRRTPLAQAAAMAALTATLMATPLRLQAQTGPGALPSGLQVVQGQASVATQGTQMTVKNSAGAILNWQSFAIGAAGGVHFEQAGSASKVLNRVVGNEPSAIFGSLTSNGQVWLLNPNGVLFGAGARVDVAGLVTSTLRLNDNDFLAGRYRFSAADGAHAGIRNEGALTSSFGGQVVLLGESVENTGRISAPGGSVSLAAARSVELVDTGLPNLSVKVKVPAGEVLNLGALAAPGGTVDVYGGIVNQSGWVQADTLGTDAQGRVVLHAADTLTLGAGSVTRAVGSEAGAAGGAVDLLGAQVAVLGRAVVDASGDAGGGSIRLGGGAQGRDRSLPNARAVWFGPEASLRADTTGAVGNGGRIVLWSDEATRAYGRLSARGGSLAGDGGFIETSGGWLDARPAAVGLAAPGGRAGLWLLDPNDIHITDLGPDTQITGGPVFTSTNDNSVISTATIAAALNAGTSVTVATGTGGTNSQPGDVFFDGATLNLTPTAPVTFTVQAARDIVVRNSTVTSTGQPLSLDFQAAGSGIGAIEILLSSIATAGGNITLGGSIAQQLPLPGGGVTAQTYRPAVGYNIVSGAPSSTSSGGNDAIAVADSTLNLGGGSFSATGYSTIDNHDAVVIGTLAGTTVINAGRIDLVGFSFVPNPVQFDTGVYVRGNATDLTATTGITIEGGGRTGIEISDGARVTLNAVPASGASFTLTGYTSDDAAVGLLSDNFDPGTAGRGTRLTVNNAAFSITGTADTGAGLVMLNNSLAPGPLLDLANATGVTLTAQQTGSFPIEPAFLLSDVELVLAKNATTTLQGNGLVSLTAVAVSGENATLSMAGRGFSINASTLAASAGTLAIDFATTGASPTGVLLENTIVDTGGGDLRFGALQTVSSSVLGSTTVAAPWVETTADNGNYAGPSIPAALWLLGSTIDAGSGRVVGGGAARTGAFNTAGVTLDGSIVSAREITLAGRSETESGINVAGGTYSASRVIDLQSLNSTAGFWSTAVLRGTVLQVIDPTLSAGSGLRIQAVHAGAGPALTLAGGDAGSGNETTVTVDGGALSLIASTAGGVGSLGLDLTGTAAVPGGLLINALGATAVDINASNAGTDGPALTMSHMNLLGPQNSATSPLNISASGGRLTGTPSTVFTGLNLSSAGPVNVLTDGLQVTGSQLGGDAGLLLQTRTGSGGRAEAPIAITGSTLAVSAAAAELRIEGSQGDAVRGGAGFNAGQGLTLTGSTLSANTGSGVVVLRGRGADSGGDGLMVEGSQISGYQVNMVGAGSVDGHGIVLRQAASVASQVNATGLAMTGVGADSQPGGTHVGVYLQDFTGLHFSNRGVADIGGSSAVFDGQTVSGGTVLVDGDIADFRIRVDSSMRLRDTLLDFSAGIGTAVELQGDVDGNQAGRVRLDNVTVRTAGGNFSASGVGLHAFDLQGNSLPVNTTLASGTDGLLLAGAVIEAGGGSVTLDGRGATDGRTPSATDAGASGINTTGSNSIDAGSIVLVGHGGDKGSGIDIGSASPGAVLNLQAGAIGVTGTGVGVDPETLTPLPGVVVSSASSWTASGVLDVRSLSSPLVLAGLIATADRIGLDAGGALTLQASAFTTGGAFAATATGATVNGSLFSLLSTSVTAGGALTLDATATTPGVALSLLSGVALSGGSVSLSGTASGAVSNAPGISAVAPAGSITATSGPLDITGRNPALDTEGILLEGAWALQAPNVINIVSDGTTLLRSPIGFSASPTFSAGQAVNLTLNSPLGISLGGVSSALDANTLGIALAGQSPTSTFTLSVSDASGLLVDQPFSLPARLQLRSPLIAFSATGSLTSTAPGDAIVLNGSGGNAIAAFDNQAGPGALSAPNGRWVVQLQDPASANLGGLGGDFTAYNLAAAPWAVDASGNLVTPAPGNAIAYAVAPATLTGTALGGLLDKVYDATTGITLDPLAWTLNGLLAGDTLTLSGASTATLADKNVGSGKAVTLNPASVFSVADGNGNPVFGYGLPVFTATVTPAPLLVFGVGVASKVYDGGTVAPVTGTPTVTPLGADLVGVASISASFSDKNVGTGKLVAYTGATLSGADAGNYTVQLPVGALADITPLALPVTGLTASNKVYDGTTLATLNGSAAVGALAGDSVLLAGSAAASFADKNVGTAKTVTLSGLTLTGTDAGNYTLVQPAAFTADITPLALALTGLSPVDKVYDATTVALLTGTAGITPLAGDTVTLAGTAVGSFGDKNVGTNKLVAIGGLTLAGADAGNYQLSAPVGANASITPAPLTLAGVTAANKVYDASTAASATASLGGVLAGDTVGVAVAASFADANVGSAKAVSYSATPAGADAANYTLALASGSTVADITPATLVYVADTLSVRAGSVLPALTGSVIGFVGGETLAGATAGTLLFSTAATASSPPGSYGVDGGGLAALNYLFVQAPGNATALTLSAAAASDPATAANQVALTLALQSVQVPLAMSSPIAGRVLDVTPALALGGVDGGDGGDGSPSFRAVNFSLMPRDEVQSLLAARASYKKKVFAGGLSKLELDPALADVPACKTEAELDAGNCLVTAALKQEIETIAARAAVRPRKADRRKLRQAALPNIERKLALLIGINRYDDKRVPELGGAVPDARAVRALLEGRLGYETTVVENAKRETIVRAFNMLAMEAGANDSVVVYYAGHGEVVPVNGVDVGYWLPADVNPDEPKTWMSNSDIARLVAAIGARQMMVVSDSCYSGTLVGAEKVQLDQRTNADELLKRKAAVVLSSGGNEPVADEGRDGHSVFAWHFMRAIEGLDQWQVGTNVFERVRAAVVKDFPQTPQYGASRTAGHQGNTDYLFERREFEAVVPAPAPAR